MKALRKISCLLAAILLLCLAAPAAAKTCRFTDVPDNYWAAADIEALAAGGLVGGYGDGRYGPENPLHIAHVATIICNATGHNVESDQEYWAYEAVRHCRDDLKCMPDLGDITRENYSVMCTREEAISMLVLGLCVNDQPSDEAVAEWTAEDIPDYDQINPAYAEAILKAYRLGIVYGIDDTHTFNPLGTFKRSHICAIMNRAGYNTKVEPVVPAPAPSEPVTPEPTPTPEPVPTPTPAPGSVAVGMSGADIYEEVKSWGLWTEFAPEVNSAKALTATDPIHGGIRVSVNEDGLITILMREQNRSAWIKNNAFCDAYGNRVSLAVEQKGFFDENGKFIMSSGWSYEARQLVKRVMALAFPESIDEAYQAVLGVMKQETWESSLYALPSAVRWLDNRCLAVSLDDGNHAVCIHLCPSNETVYYDELRGTGDNTENKSYYPSANGNRKNIPAMYELDRG